MVFFGSGGFIAARRMLSGHSEAAIVQKWRVRIVPHTLGRSRRAPGCMSFAISRSAGLSEAHKPMTTPP